MSPRIKTLVFGVDREELNRITSILEEDSRFIVVGTAARAIDAIKMVRQLPPDVIIMSDQLYGGTGFDVKECIDTEDIVVSMFSQKNLYEQSVHAGIDYFIHPDFNEDTLNDLVTLTVTKTKRMEPAPYQASSLSFQQQILTVPVTSGIRSVRLSDILFLEADGSYTTIHTINQKPIVVSKRLKLFENSLFNIHFIRVNRNYLVNLFHIVEINKRDYFLTLTDGNQLEFSQRKKDDLIDFVKSRTSFI